MDIRTAVEMVNRDLPAIGSAMYLQDSAALTVASAYIQYHQNRNDENETRLVHAARNWQERQNGQDNGR